MSTATATLTKPITVTDVMTALEQVVAEAANGPHQTAKDEYRDRHGKAHCIAACVVDKLAPHALGLLTEGRCIDDPPNDDLLIECGFTGPAITVLRTAQNHQDNHETWGEAVTAARLVAIPLAAREARG